MDSETHLQERVLFIGTLLEELKIQDNDQDLFCFDQSDSKEFRLYNAVPKNHKSMYQTNRE